VEYASSEEAQMSSQARIPALKALAASALLLIAVGVAPVAAEVIKRECSQPCRSGHTPVITAPDGWSGDPAAERMNALIQVLVPTGKQFIDSDQTSWASADPKPADETLAEYMKTREAGGKRTFKGLKYMHLPDLPRGNGKEPFRLLLTQRPNTEQLELAAITVDTDSDGNSYVVTIWLSASDSNTLSAAMPSFQKVLLSYG
jgi:hypothetical protein